MNNLKMISFVVLSVCAAHMYGMETVDTVMARKYERHVPAHVGQGRQAQVYGAAYYQAMQHEERRQLQLTVEQMKKVRDADAESEERAFQNTISRLDEEAKKQIKKAIQDVCLHQWPAQ